MIKLLGVLTPGGVPIACKSFDKEVEEVILSALIGAVMALSRTLGTGDARKVDFNSDKLVITKSKKGLIVIALASKGEDYVEALLKLLAEELDNAFTGIIPEFSTPEHANIASRIFDKFVSNTIEFSFRDLISEIWYPILSILMSDAKFRKLISNVQELERREEEKYIQEWKKFSSKIQGTKKDAIIHALAGNFSHACAIALKEKDLTAKLFGVRMGIFAHLTAFVPSPELDELEKEIQALPRDNIFVKLIESDLKLLKRQISLMEYIEVFKETIKKFEFKDDDEHIMLAFLLIKGAQYFPQIAKKLERFFSNKSEVIYTFIHSSLKARELIEKIYGITKFDEIRPQLLLCEKRLKIALGELDKIIPSPFKRLFRKAPYESEVNKTLFKVLSTLETCVAVLVTLLQTPVLTLKEKKEVANKVLSIYYNYFRKLLSRKLPIFIGSVFNIFQHVSAALSDLYHLSEKRERKRLLNMIIEFLKDVLNFTYIDRSKIYSSKFLDAILAGVNSLLAEQKKSPEVILILTYILMQSINVEDMEAKKTLFPYWFVATTLNILNTLIPLIPMLSMDIKLKTEILKKCFYYVNEILKWLMAHAEITKYDILPLIDVVSLMENIPESELREMVEYILSWIKIVIPNINKYDYDFVLIAEPLINFLIKVGKKLNDNKYLIMAREYLQFSEKIWRKYELDEKAKDIISDFSKKLNFIQ